MQWRNPKPTDRAAAFWSVDLGPFFFYSYKTVAIDSKNDEGGVEKPKSFWFKDHVFYVDGYFLVLASKEAWTT